MNKILNSCTIVPENLYVERDADRQIRQIIDGMGRPGYVLVARQMGKTNLLFHTRKKLETSSVLFTYVDFSSIGGYTETDCFNYLIDETINLHPDILSQAENEIDELRKKPNYSGYKMFTRELRVILKYVDKLVFILDEIDALTRTAYSDHVFSTIRSHYFQRDNYEDLNKLTYILSGVIEPKDIIKDPNISPFNIGEKIYMNDFSRDEFNRFITKTGITILENESLQDRIYYWTNGNPRITWDVCSLVEDLSINTEEALDKAINKYYLTTFDKAPIDTIREKVQKEDVLKDALIQLYFNKGESLSIEVQNRLYLAGIIDFDNNKPQLKNPILKECLKFEWLMSLESQKMDYLKEADHAIWMSNDYKKAINYLSHYMEELHTEEEEDKANYLLGVAHCRLFNYENSEKSLNKVKSKGSKSKFYYSAMLELAYVYMSSEQYNAALECYNKIKRVDVTDDKIWLKSQIGKVGLIIKVEDKEKLDEAEQILIEIIGEQSNDRISLNMLSQCQYYLSCIYELKQLETDAISHLDLALNIAQQNEKQVLLFKKLSIVKEPYRSLVAEELYQSLSNIETKPQSEDFDNPLAFNQISACQILAYLILNYPQYDVRKYLRLFLFSTKENAVLYIDTVLNQLNDSLATSFFCYIKEKLFDEEWNFEEEQRANIALLDWDRNSDSTLAKQYASSLSSSSIHDVGLKSFDILLRLAKASILEKKLEDANLYYHLFNDNVTNYKGITLNHRFHFDYYYAAILYQSNPYSFSSFSANLLDRLNKHKNTQDDKSKQDEINNLIKNVSDLRNNFYNALFKSEKNEVNYSNVGRNSKIKVKYLSNGRIEEGKYKKFKDDIDKDLCCIIEVINL